MEPIDEMIKLLVSAQKDLANSDTFSKIFTKHKYHFADKFESTNCLIYCFFACLDNKHKLKVLKYFSKNTEEMKLLNAGLNFVLRIANCYGSYGYLELINHPDLATLKNLKSYDPEFNKYNTNKFNFIYHLETLSNSQKSILAKELNLEDLLKTCKIPEESSDILEDSDEENMDEFNGNIDTIYQNKKMPEWQAFDEAIKQYKLKENKKKKIKKPKKSLQGTNKKLRKTEDYDQVLNCLFKNFEILRNAEFCKDLGIGLANEIKKDIRKRIKNLYNQNKENKYKLDDYNQDSNSEQKVASDIADSSVESYDEVYDHLSDNGEEQQEEEEQEEEQQEEQEKYFDSYVDGSEERREQKKKEKEFQEYKRRIEDNKRMREQWRFFLHIDHCFKIFENIEKIPTNILQESEKEDLKKKITITLKSIDSIKDDEQDKLSLTNKLNELNKIYKKYKYYIARFDDDLDHLDEDAINQIKYRAYKIGDKLSNFLKDSS